MTIFKVATEEEAGQNWVIALTGGDWDGHSYEVQTDHVHASELHQYSGGAKSDAEIIAALLNEYYNNPELRATIQERIGVVTK